MTKASVAGMMAGAAIMAAVGARSIAFAKGKTPSGDMNLRLQGYEVLSATQSSVLAIGQEIVDANGNFGGDETSTGG